MAVGEVLMLLFMIFSSIGISFTSASVGESLQDAFSNGHIEFPAADPSARETFKEMLDANQGLSEFVIPPEAVNSDGNVSASDLANAGVNPAEWMQANQGNITQSPSNSTWTLGSGSSACTIKSISFPSAASMNGAGFNHSCSFYGNYPHSVIAVYTSDNSLYYFYTNCSSGRPSDENTAENIAINNLTYIRCDSSNDYYLADITISYFKNGALLTVNTSTGIWLPPYHYEASEPIDDPLPSLAEAAVGSAVIGGQIYELNPDGSVTVDGTDYPMNPDGTVTINGVTYYPQIALPGYNDEALQGLLRQILSKLNELENKLEFEDTAAEDVAAPDIAYEGTMSELLYNSPKWAQVFPFCLPWDFVRGVKLLSSPPVAPVFKIPFDIPQIGAFPGYHGEIVLDFAEYDKYFVVVRWFSTVFFVMGLIFISFKIVKGVK